MEQGKLQGWQADPFGQHEQRYFSAGEPTKLVRDGGTESYDEPPVVASAPDPAADATAAGTLDDAVAVAAADAATGQEPAFDGPPSDELAAVGSAAPDEHPPAESPPQLIGAAARSPGLAAHAAESWSSAADAPVTAAAAEGSLAPGEETPDQGSLDSPFPRRRRSLLYSAVAVAAVVVVVAVVALTGGFSSHGSNPPANFGSTLGSDGGSGSGASGANTGPAVSGMAPAAFVTSAAQRTLAQNTADVAVSGSVGGAGRVLSLQGTGQVNFGAGTIAIDLSTRYGGQAITEDEVETSQSFFLQLATNGRNALGSTGRQWMEFPIAQATAGGFPSASPVWSLRLLQQQGAVVTSLGTRSFSGLSCVGYLVTPSRQALLAAARQQFAQLRLTKAETSTDLQTLQAGAPPTITAWFDPQRQLACQLGVDMQLSDASQGASSTPTAITTLVTLTFTHYGVPVHISPPATSASVIF